MSTKDNYLQAGLNYQFRKLFLTQITELRFLGLKENVFGNYLYTPDSQNYMEVGYSLDGILKFIRLEAVTLWQDGEFKDFGFRVGISRALSITTD